MYKFISCAFFIALTFTPVRGQNDWNIEIGLKVKHIDSILNRLYAEGVFNGNILISEKDEVVYNKSFGFADHSNGIKLSDKSIFNIASISKIFTATAIMMLKEQGKLKLKDRITKYLPELPYDEVTLEHLLSHTSGIIKEQRAPFFYEIQDKAFTNEELYRVFVKVSPKLVTSPGVKYMYSNSNYAFLALVVERVSNQRFHDFLIENIFHPLGMHKTFLKKSSIPKELNNQIAKPHQKLFTSKDFLVNEKQDSTFINIYGEGWIYSTVNDLSKFHRSLHNGKLLKRESLNRMFKPIELKDNEPYELSSHSNYPATSALAWRVAKDSSNGKVVYHSGGVLGGRTILMSDLSNNRLMVCLTNNEQMGRYTFTFPMSVLQNRAYVLDKKSLAKEFGKTYALKGMDAALEFYDKNKSNSGYIAFSGWDYEDIGNELIKKGDLTSAIKLFGLYVSEYPNASFGWRKLGDVQFLKRKMDKAKVYYSKAMKLTQDKKEIQMLQEAIRKTKV